MENNEGKPKRKPRKTKAAREAVESKVQDSKAVYSIFGSDYVSMEQMGAEHIIVHLNTTTSECDNLPKPYEAGDDEFSEIGPKHAANKIPTPKTTTDPEVPVQSLLSEFQKRTNDNDWPSDTNVWCHWCCHPFSGPPICLPSRVIEVASKEHAHRWEVSGCFCSFNCAAAYNFEVNDDSDDVWETYALLNHMNAEVSGMVDRVLPAPPRNTLKVFGGYLEIEDFRRKSLPSQYVSMCGEVRKCKGSLIDSLRFPMMYVPQQVEEINEANISQPLRFIPVDTEHIHRVKEKQLQLKRSKPVVNPGNTLEKVMNLRITE